MVPFGFQNQQLFSVTCLDLTILRNEYTKCFLWRTERMFKYNEDEYVPSVVKIFGSVGPKLKDAMNGHSLRVGQLLSHLSQ
jgi:hypothetical protein